MAIGNTTPSKPGIGTQVNYGHPLATGLRHCILLNEWGSGQVLDLVYGRKGTLRGSAVWQQGPSGPGVNPGGVDGSDINFTEGGLWMPKNNISIFIRYAPAGTTPAAPTAGSITGAGIDAYHWAAGGGGQTTAFSLSGIVGLDSTMGQPASSFKECSVGIAYTRGVRVFYYQKDPTNGTQTQTVTNASTPIAITGQPSTIGSKWGSSVTSFSGRIYSTYIWDRLLSQSEFEWLDAEPYAFLGRPKTKIGR